MDYGEVAPESSNAADLDVAFVKYDLTQDTKMLA